MRSADKALRLRGNVTLVSRVRMGASTNCVRTVQAVTGTRLISTICLHYMSGFVISASGVGGPASK